MSDERYDLLQDATTGGLAGDHPAQKEIPTLAGPATSDEKNTYREPLVVIACWRMDDVRFEFDSSFINPDAADELRLLAVLRKRRPTAPPCIFGHADPVGNDAYNKKLSGRRATAVYALLTRDVGLWEDLYSDADGTNDTWGAKSIQTMRSALGLPAGGTEEKDTGARAALFRSYMDAICKDLDGKQFKLAKGDFLGKGGSAAGKGDYQGCSEFNPVLMFSKEENDKYAAAKDKTARNEDNAPNRRVVIFLFKPGSRIDLGKWPCPTVKQGIAGCEKRFWSDHKQRRSFQAERRQYEKTNDTFACRFYDRLAIGTSCEAVRRVVSMRIFFQKYPGTAGTDEQRGIADVPYKLRVIGIKDREAKTEKDGSVKIVMPAGAAAVLEIFGSRYDLSARNSIEALDKIEGVQRRLDMLGYHPGDITGSIGVETDQAILELQADNALDTNGDSELEAGRSTDPAADIRGKLKAQVGE